MRRSRSWPAFVAGTATVLALGLTPVTQASATPDGAARSTVPAATDGAGGDVRELAPDRKARPLDKATSRRAVGSAKADSTGTPQVGDTRTWLGDDEVNGPYLKRYVLRAVGPHVQVWLANDRSFPTDDCRNDLGLTNVTQKQINRFVREFSDNMYPKESKVFSVPPARNGKGGADLAQAVGLPADYWKVGKKQADDIVVLVDNVRDENYYTPDTPDGQTFVAGFFWSYFNELTDRNIMTIDAFDWLHRTGANPPDDSANPDYQSCAEELGKEPDYFRARAHDYEGTFAHEYQHLLEYYQDPDEVNWVNEGTSDWAQTLTGYVDPRIDVANKDADGHMACFAGFAGARYGGPENSLTQWSDQGGPEILCDYGAAYSFMEYLASHWGTGIMTKLHRIQANGLDGLDKALDAVGAKPSAMQVLHRWAAMVAVDKAIDRNGGKVHGGKAGQLSAKSLRFHLKWGNPQAWNGDGVNANGADFVRLRDGGGSWLGAGDIRSISFTGDQGAEPYPVEWTVDATPPNSIPSDAADDQEGCNNPPAAGDADPALYSGCGDDLDRSIAHQVSVPQNDPTLSFDTLYDIEQGWDFGVVQVSADGGRTWTTVPTTDSTSEHDPQAEPRIVDELPGLTGRSDGWQTETADLSQWAGQDVLLSFRYLTDGAWAETGWYVRNIDVGGTAVPATLDGWQTQSQLNPDPVTWTVQLIGYGAKNDPVWYHRMRLGGDRSEALSGAALRDAIGNRATTVAAIVFRDDRSEKQATPAYYNLQVNGVTQPGSTSICNVRAAAPRPRC